MNAEELAAIRERYFGMYDGPRGSVPIYKPLLAHPDPVQLTEDLETLFQHIAALREIAEAVAHCTAIAVANGYGLAPLDVDARWMQEQARALLAQSHPS